MLPREQYYENLSKKIIKSLEKRNMVGYYYPTKDEAIKQVLNLIDKESTVSWGGSMTLHETGLLEALKKENLTLLDRSQCSSPEEIHELYHQALSADYYLMSTNAITMDGKLVNIDGNGNRLAALIYGPRNVIIVVGMNKVVLDEEAGLKRVRNEASPINTVRLNMNTPCSKIGHCHDCLCEDTICCQTVITRMSRHPGRINVILIGEEYGY
ncbi:lactate utilization protein [Vallitalea okinawensis]|uniref:lactate utilization protein n=1 Tax=Vallitalea okinawensis TaxID=2078660 RepID=UPI000CFB60BF|nr:lactate utilization protein [Vallitalea okinawensis]